MLELSFGFLITAFLGGFIMFLAPCTLPLVPAFLASLVTGKNTSAPSANTLRLKAVLFSVGFTIIFVSFGVLTGLFGAQLTSYKLLISQLGGVLVIIFGLSLMSGIHIPFLSNSASPVTKFAGAFEGPYTPVLLGALFALGWTPCAGPILASILLLASQTGAGFDGGILLFVFSLGLAVPFVLVGFLYAHMLSIFRVYEKYVRVIRTVSGVFLLTLGVLLVFQNTILMTHWGFSLYSFFGYTPMCTYF